ncbi:MAG: hypothetical protein R3F34_17845 [Planctomycetota bacterium]
MTTDGATSGSVRAASAALLLASALLVSFALIGPIASGDLFWHLEMGRWILEHRALPVDDPFSFTATQPAELQEYGSQVLFALAERAVGLGGLRHVGALLGVLLLLAAYRTALRRVDLPFAVALTAIFALLCAYKWELRPQLLSALILLRLVHVLFVRDRDDPSPGPRAWIECLVLGCVWVQLHAEALFAPILAATGLVGAVCAAIFERGTPRPLRRIGRWTACTAFALGGTFLSPLGAMPHLYAIHDRSKAQTFVEEWQPIWIPPGDARAFPLVPEFQVAVWVLALVAVLFLARRVPEFLTGTKGRSARIGWERFGLLCLCVLLAFTARRYFWLLWFPLVELAALVRARRGGETAALGALFVGALALVPMWRTQYVASSRVALRDGRFAETVDTKLFPVYAVDVVRGAELDGNLFHPYSWGGYLGYELGPANKVFVDGRTVMFADVIPVRQRAERDLDFARDVFAKESIDVVVFLRVVDHGDGPFLWKPPDAEREWVRVWIDELAVVWLRRSRTDALDRLEAWYAGEGVEFDRERGASEYAVLEARPDWLDSRAIVPGELRDQVRELLPATASGGRRAALAWYRLGDLAWRNAMERSARHAYVRALAALRGRLDADAEREALADYASRGNDRAFAALRKLVEAARDPEERP